jgi:hypothetical protein
MPNKGYMVVYSSQGYSIVINASIAQAVAFSALIAFSVVVAAFPATTTVLSLSQWTRPETSHNIGGISAFEQPAVGLSVLDREVLLKSRVTISLNSQRLC